MWRCPDCGSDRLGVTVITSANLIQEPDDNNYQTEIDGDHEWDQGSTMWCKVCNCVGGAGQFVCNLPIANLQDPRGPMPKRRHTDEK